MERALLLLRSSTGQRPHRLYSLLEGAEGPPMVGTSTPYIWLGPRWDAWLEFGPDSSRAAFQRIARRVSDEIGASVVEVLPGPRDEDKEYAELCVGSARLLLMRKQGLGVGLSARYPDVPLLLRIGAAFGASCHGWRWPLYRIWRRLSRQGSGPAEGESR